MSIQSNINSLIGQSAMLMALSPGIQQAGELERKKVRYKELGGQIETMRDYAAKVGRSTNIVPAFKTQDESDYYNKLQEEHAALGEELKSHKKLSETTKYAPSETIAARRERSLKVMKAMRAADRANESARDSLLSKMVDAYGQPLKREDNE